MIILFLSSGHVVRARSNHNTMIKLQRNCNVKSLKVLSASISRAFVIIFLCKRGMWYHRGQALEEPKLCLEIGKVGHLRMNVCKFIFQTLLSLGRTCLGNETWCNGHCSSASQMLFVNTTPSFNDRGEPALSYRWAGWVWEITGWSSRLQENYRSF